jgi:hypothetical protein
MEAITMSMVKMRQEVERKIAKALVVDALKTGFVVSVDNGEEESAKFDDVKSILNAMFLTDEERLYMWNPTNGKMIGWVYLVYGNSGWDVISDYTVNLEPIMAGANKIADHYES